MRRTLLLLCVLLTVGALPALGGCGAGEEKAVTGLVTGVDRDAGTFAVRGTDGRSYAFRMGAKSKGDLAEIKEHMDKKLALEVKYKGATPPYEVVSAD